MLGYKYEYDTASGSPSYFISPLSVNPPTLHLPLLSTGDLTLCFTDGTEAIRQ